MAQTKDQRCPKCGEPFETGTTCRVHGTFMGPTSRARRQRLASKTSLAGRRITPRFTLSRRIGSGGMGEVYAATQHPVNREVAIKVIHGSRKKDDYSVPGFMREARLASQIKHPNSVTVLDFGRTEDGLLFLVMERLRGRPLDEVMGATGALSVARALRIAGQIADGLGAGHRMGILHRDLKPGNVMVLDDPPGRDALKILDFGLAFSLTHVPDFVTVPGQILGTPSYMAPEVIKEDRASPQSDLYALGTILYEMIAGRRPHEARSMTALLRNVINKTPPAIHCPEPVQALIARLMAKKPADRFQDAASAMKAIRDVEWALVRDKEVEPPRPWRRSLEVLGDEAESDEPDRPPGPGRPGRRPAESGPKGVHERDAAPRRRAAVAPRPARRGRWLWIAAVGLITAGVGFTVWALGNLGPGESAREGTEASKPDRGAPPRGGVVTVSLTEQVPPAFDLHPAIMGSDAQVYAGNIYESLIRRDERGGFTPGVVTQWRVGGEGRTVDLVLRDRLRFHHAPCAADGPSVPVITADLAYSIRLHWSRSASVSVLAAVEAGPAAQQPVTITGPGRVRIRLAHPSPYLESHLAATPLLPAGVAACGGPTGVAHPAGTGPFAYQGREANGDVVLTRFDEYWRRSDRGHRLPYIDRLRFSVVTEVADAIARLREGRLHLFHASRGALDAVVESRGGRLELTEDFADYPMGTGLRTYPQHAIGIAILVVHSQKGPLASEGTRRRLVASIDRARLASERVGLSRPSSRLLEPHHLGYDPIFDPGEAPPRDPSARPRRGFVLGAPISVGGLARALEPDLNRAGVPARITVSSIDEFERGLELGSWDAVLVPYPLPHQGDEAVGLVHFATTLSTGLFPHFSGTKERPGSAYRLAKQILASGSRLEREALYRRLERRLLEGAHLIPIGKMAAEAGRVYLVHERLGGFVHPKTRHTRAYPWQGHGEVYVRPARSGEPLD